MGKGKPNAPAGAQRRVSPRSAFIRQDGHVRTGWLLAAAILAWVVVDSVARYGLAAAFAGLFGVWGINAENARLAPAWARLIYGWHGSAITLTASVASIALSLGLRRLFRFRGGANGAVRVGARLALVGLAVAAGSAALFVLTDSFRLEWPPGEPRLSAALPALVLISLIGVLAEELFTKRVLYDLAVERWGKRWAAICATAAAFLLGGGLSGGVVGALNVLLLGALCCTLYDRSGLAAPVGLRWGWSAANLLLLGFGGGEHSLYRLYAVSEARFTGGDAGLICGLCATLMLCAGLVWLARGAVTRALCRMRSRMRGKA